MTENTPIDLDAALRLVRRIRRHTHNLFVDTTAEFAAQAADLVERMAEELAEARRKLDLYAGCPKALDEARAARDEWAKVARQGDTALNQARTEHDGTIAVLDEVYRKLHAAEAQRDKAQAEYLGLCSFLQLEGYELIDGAWKPVEPKRNPLNDLKDRLAAVEAKNKRLRKELDGINKLLDKAVLELMQFMPMWKELFDEWRAALAADPKDGE
jgi:chromosome segregation ATPase